MSRLRYDILTGNSVIISENRASRPNEMATPANKPVYDIKDTSNCPFCPGNEEKTPPNFMVKGDPWHIRIVPNKYPAVSSTNYNYDYDDFYCTENISGSHYVIIDSNKHFNYVHNMTIEEIVSLLHAYAHSIDVLYKEKNIKYVQVFKNYKKEGGSSLEHTHSQVIALSFIPEKIKTIIDNAEKYYKQNNRCIFCDILNKELAQDSRVIYKTDSFTAFCPYASMFAHEISIYPNKHMSNFSSMADSEYSELAATLKFVFSKLYTVLNDPAFNMYISCIKDETNYFHWSIDVIPRTSIQAGFELSTGVMLNTVAPETTKVLFTMD